ncbi:MULTISPECIES: efflux RND transporter periplasmic adaptor subunit [Comamonas]|uniref:efflux RND transporter periplasmic adaptor subunit n=1 Tax=Comamonas TaxID=283 RepID=UPI0005F8827B|nr:MULTISPECIES: efflux RND transporter periplasmic adaptor subunit [Comamonas]GAO70764.1 cytochrome C peroxidase [Comamonas sp. E6]CUA91827.1 RND family efflux transporter, MFP subunit [Comamonas thiooxydans]
MNSTSSKPRRTAIAIAIILALGAAAAAAIVYGTQPAAISAEGHGHGAAEKSHAHEEKNGHEHDEKEGHDHGSEPGHEQAASTGKPAAKPESAHADDEDEGLLKLDAERARAAGVALAEAGPALIASMLQLPGEIRFNEDRTAHVVPRVAGVAESVAANLGQVVKKGQLLATLTSPAVSEQRSELMAAQKRLALARTTYQREKQLWQEKISAEQDYLQAQQALREAEIASANAQQKLAAIGAGSGSAGALNRFELRAPFDGVVVEKHLSVGEAVQDSTAVFTISDLRSVWAEMKVAASDLPFVRVGEKATVHATAFESKATGTVAYVGALIGQETRTAPARITLDNPDGIWRPGLFVNVDLTASSQKAAVTVASAAIQKIDGDKPVVFVPVDGGFRAQVLKLGKTDGQNTEVLQGLSTGQRYVKDGSFVLKSELGKATAEHVH